MTYVKVCGMMEPEEACAVAHAGVDFLGLVFYPRSSRCVTPDRAREIVSAVRSTEEPARLVGVFVDESPERVLEVVRQCDLDMVQLHGNESPQTVGWLIEQGIMVIKAFRVRDGSSLDSIGSYPAVAYLLDAYVPDRPGGTGSRFDWSLATAAKAHGKVVLAGGLDAGNVSEAVRTVQPWGVDVSSGVEISPGHKNIEEVRRFIAEAKKANPLSPGRRELE